MIIQNYLQKEIYKNTLAVSSILLLISLANRLSSYLSKAVAGLIPMTWVGKLVLLYMPELIGIILPIGFYFGAVFAFSRLYAEQEMMVLETSGFGPVFFFKIIFKIGAILALINGLFSFWILPHSAHYRESQIAEGEAFTILQTLTPGRFQNFPGKENLIFYIENQNSAKQPQNVLIIQPPSQNKPELLLIQAKTASLEKKQNENQTLFLTLKEGFRYEGQPFGEKFSKTAFSEYGQSLDQQKQNSALNQIKLKSTQDLIKNSDRESKIELQWRLELALSPFFLGFLAFVLSQTSPREGRFSKFLPALIAYLIYYNLMILGRNFASNHYGIPIMFSMHLAPLCSFIFFTLYTIKNNAYSR
ncbi:MAG: LPS export ABC transporter permease LptF [Gammaproteobacteria bacterium]